MIAVIALVLFLQTIPPIPFPTIASPTPIATSTPFAVMTLDSSSAGGLRNYLATAERALSTPPATYSVPNEDGGEIFSYAKWLMAPDTAEEVLGVMAPIWQHITAIMGIVLALALLALIIFIVVLLIRFILWIIRVVLQFVPFLG